MLKQVVGEKDRVPLLLDAEQITLIKEHTLAEAALLNQLSLAEVVGARRQVKLTLHDLEDLEGHIAAAANHCEDRQLQARLDKVGDKLQQVASNYELHY